MFALSEMGSKLSRYRPRSSHYENTYHETTVVPRNRVSSRFGHIHYHPHHQHRINLGFHFGAPPPHLRKYRQ